ncbi:MAG: AAA family ATPase [Bdellovibrionales bacterium]|nr:AAA family ATPase [Bdellovibrionales bacterium]
MDKALIEKITNLLLLRKARIIAVCLLAYVTLILYVRNLSPDFVARTKIFVSIPEVTLGETRGMFSGLFRDRERTDLILTQRALVASYPVYNTVKEKLTQKKLAITPSSTDFEVALQDIVKYIILGKQHEISANMYDWGYFDFLDRLSFSTDIQGGNFSIGFKSSNPQQALNISKLIGEALLDLNLEIAAKRSAKVSDFLERKVQETNENLQRANEAIAEFVRQHNLPHREKLLEERYRAYIEAQRAMAKAEQIVAEKSVRLVQTRNLLTKLKTQMKESVSKTNEPRIRALMTEIAKFEAALLSQQKSAIPTASQADVSRRLRRLRSQLSEEMDTEKFYDTEALQQGLEKALGMVQIAEAEEKGAKAMYEEVKRQVNAYKSEMNKYPELEAKLEQLLFVQRQYAKMQQVLTENYLSVITQGDVRTSKLVILQDPMLDSNILGASKTKKLVLLSFAVTLLLIGGIVGLDIYRETIVGSAQLKSFQNPTYLGKFPHIRSLKRKILSLGFEENLQTAQLAFRLMRTIQTKRIAVVCSSRAMAGKTITVAALSSALAKLGKKVLMVDGDNQATNRKLMNYFRQRGGRNFAVAQSLAWVMDLAKNQTLEEWRGNRNLVVCPITLTSKTSEEHVMTLQKELLPLLQRARQTFDYVIVDAGPIYFVETGIMIEASDAVLFAVPEGSITTAELMESTRIIDLHRKEGATLYSILTNTRLEASLDSAYRYYMQPKRNETQSSENSEAA